MLIFDQLNRADRHLRVLAWVFALGLVVLAAGLWWVQVVRSRYYVDDLRTQSYRTVRVPAPRGRIMDRNGVVLAENKPVYNISLYLEDRSWRNAVQQQYKAWEAALKKSVRTTRKPKSFETFLSKFGYKPDLVTPRRLTTAERTHLGKETRFFVTSNIVAQLSQVLGEPLILDEEKFHKHYELMRALPLPIVANLSSNQIARFQEQSTRLPGVDMEMQPVRIYPRGTNAAHVVGCLTRSDESAEGELAFYNYKLPDYRGYSGVEATLDEELRGRAGAKAVLVNNLGYRQSETILSPVEPGHHVTLTLDMEIQAVAERKLGMTAGVETPIRGAVVVLDIRTGEVIAMASAPTFDPNHWIPYLPKATWNSYTNEDIAPLQNRAAFGHYAPGSTFKIVGALAGLERGTLKPDEVIVVEPNRANTNRGAYYIGNRPWRDTAPPGEYKFKRAFIKSSNSYFIQQGMLSGAESITSLAEKLGFGEKTGILLQESKGLVPTTDWMRKYRGGGWSHAGVANLSIGQGDLDVTPLQLAVAIAAVANGGKVLTPQIVLQTTKADELIPPAHSVGVKPIVRHSIPFSAHALQVVRDAMRADVEDEDGTGKKARVPGYPICGKTGTAQVEKNGEIHHFTVWFASYAPADDPRYAVIVMADYGHAASGGGTCAPIAGEIYKHLQKRDEYRRTKPDSIALK